MELEGKVSQEITKERLEAYFILLWFPAIPTDMDTLLLIVNCELWRLAWRWLEKRDPLSLSPSFISWAPTTLFA